MAIAILGMGLMGAGLAEAALGRGETVTVWNRTREKAEALGKLGARVADSPGDAVAGASRVHLFLHADAAVDTVLGDILAAVEADTVVIDHSTTSPERTADRAEMLDTAGIAFLHVPVFMSPANCRAGTGLMVAAGAQPVFARVEAALRQMTGEVWYLGERPDLAACYKLFGNAMLLGVAGLLGDVYTMARANKIEPLQAHELFSKLDVGMAVKVRGLKMAKGDFSPSFQLDTARKDIALMLEAAQPHELAMLPGLAARMDVGLAKGLQNADFGVIAAADLESP